MGDMADLDRERFEDYAYWYAAEGSREFALMVGDPKAETEKARLFEIEGFGEHWFPKSKCAYRNGILYVPGWLLSAKGIEGASPDYMAPEDYL